VNKHLTSLAALTFVAFALVGFLTPGRASAVPGGSYTFLYTGAEQTYPVAANLTGIHVDMVGAQGASCCGATVVEPGGDGVELTADIPLPAGTSTLYVEVGGMGSAGAGGWNGGGGGPLGGGGATDIRTISCGDCTTGGSAASLNSRLAAAAGGGGASDDQGGGIESFGPPCALCGSNAVSSGGTAVPQATVTADCQGDGDTGGEAATDGALGRGAAGASFLILGTPTSGGGGGGWYGGGGGAQCFDTHADATVNAGSGGSGSSDTPTGINTLYSSGYHTDPEVVITAPVPTPITTAPPTVAGGLTIGDVLNESHGQWSGTPSGYSYQWDRCNASGASCTPIAGATGKTYTLASADLGDTIRVEETGQNFYGSSVTASTSAASGVVGEPPMSTARPTIVGTPTEGEVLLDTHGSWTDGPITSYSYQWERCNAGSCLALPGAVDDAYVLTQGDVGSKIEVQETVTNAYGTSAAATSAATSTVQAMTTATTKLALAGRPVASANGVSVALTCNGATGTGCRGSARLTTLERLLKGKIVALLARTKPHRKRATIGSKNFTLAAGARERIVVPLNRRGRKLLARFHRIPATVTITLLSASPHTSIAAHTTIERRKK